MFGDVGGEKSVVSGEGGRKAIVAGECPPKSDVGGVGQPKFVCASSQLRMEHVTVTEPGARSLWHQDLEVGGNAVVGRLGSFDR